MTCLDQVVHKYRALRCNHIGANLPELLAQAEANELSYLQLAEQLVDLEIKGREKNRLAMNLRKAGFPVAKRLEELDYRHQTTITKRQVNQLLDFRFIEERSNLVFIGPPGVGKTHLAIGIGLKAIEAGYKVLFTTALALVGSPLQPSPRPRADRLQRMLRNARPAWTNRRYGTASG